MKTKEKCSPQQRKYLLSRLASLPCKVYRSERKEPERITKARDLVRKWEEKESANERRLEKDMRKLIDTACGIVHGNHRYEKH